MDNFPIPAVTEDDGGLYAVPNFYDDTDTIGVALCEHKGCARWIYLGNPGPLPEDFVRAFKEQGWGIIFCPSHIDEQDPYWKQYA